MFRYFVILSLVLVNAAYAEWQIGSLPPLEPDPTVYLEAAMIRARQFIPGVEFNSVNSMLVENDEKTGFCSKRAWKFTFFEPITQDFAYVEVRLVEITSKDLVRHCSTAYNVRIEHDYYNSNILFKTLANPKEKLGIGFDQVISKLQKNVREPFSINYIKMEVVEKDKKLLVMMMFHIKCLNSNRNYRVNMETGQIEAW